MKKLYNFIAIAVFIFILFFFPIATKLAEHKEYSFYENRNLEPVPVFTKETLFDGTYLPKWDKYFSDQIAFRDEMIYAYTYINANIFKKVNVNNIVITENSLLPFNQPKQIDETSIKNSCESVTDKISKLSDFCEKSGAEFIFVGIPEQRSMLRNDYPDYLENDDEYLNLVENHFFKMLNSKNVDYLNMMDIFSKEDYRGYYSVTDHHFNIFGAFRTYTAIMEKLDCFGCADGKLTESDFNLVTLEHNFYGSRARMIYKAYPIPDNLAYYEPKEKIDYERFDRGTKVERIFFVPSDVNEDITYGVYMGGDNGETYIHTNRPELKKLLIFGDSFTNPLETLLYTGFDSMLTVDLRHNKKSIYEYIEEFSPDVVLLVRDDTCYLSTDGNGNF
jgi:hypothetical protein